MSGVGTEPVGSAWDRPRFRRQPFEGAFTLIELMVSVALMSLVLAAAYMCFSSGVATQRLVDNRVDVAQQARVAMGLLVADLRCAAPLSKEMEFLGMDRMLGTVEADNMDFGTCNYGPRRPGEGDFCEVSYYLMPETGMGTHSLWRRRQPGITAEPLSGGERVEIARGLQGLRFEYYDGLDWYDEWGDPEGRRLAESSLRQRPNVKGLPEAVRITMWFGPEPEVGDRRGEGGEQRAPPLMFQTVARLELAPLTYGTSSSSGGGSDESGQETAEPGGANMPAGGGS